MQEILQFLKRHPYFAGLPQPALEEIARLVRRRKASRGEQILIEGEPPASAYFVVHGQVRIYRLSPSGREQALMDIFPGQTFNLVSAVDGRPAPSSAVARTDALLYAISRQDFIRLMERYPSIAQAVLKDFARRLRHMTALVEDLALRTVSERLARLLLRLAEAPRQDGAPAEDGERFTQQDLANRLGTVREVVSRTLHDFQEQGLITLERGRIVIRDRERLEALACSV